MVFYQLDWKVNQRALGIKLAVIGKEPNLRVPWLMGRRFEKEVPQPIALSLSPRGGPDMPDVFLTGIPLFSDRLLEAMRKAGADNFDVYSTELADPAKGTIVRHYKAVNIIGKIEAADLKKSTFDPRSEPNLMEFDVLVIDERKVRGANLFRLAENPLRIVISERIQRALVTMPLVGVLLVPLDGREEEGA
ncbi:MAG TPA: DUF1629 domain-containing protein [Thermoanaerobaculia bacterium]|nr:DUF1629 domain-containing protein [Thermoanaerobaculia bacterium]